jgi:hypothetical protein
LHDNVVEAYFQSLEIEYFTVLTSRESHNFFVQHDHIEMIQSLDTANYLIAPICLNNNHWTCVFIDIKQSNFFYFDPKGLQEEEKLNKKYFERWTEYYSMAYPEKTQLKWSNLSIPHPRQENKDNNNCGIFICLFISRYIETKNIQFNTKPIDFKNYRSEIESTISNNSLVMSSMCSLCGNKKSNIDDTCDLVACKGDDCNLSFHNKCLIDFMERTSYMKKLSCVLCNEQI